MGSFITFMRQGLLGGGRGHPRPYFCGFVLLLNRYIYIFVFGVTCLTSDSNKRWRDNRLFLLDENVFNEGYISWTRDLTQLLPPSKTPSRSPLGHEQTLDVRQGCLRRGYQLDQVTYTVSVPRVKDLLVLEKEAIVSPARLCHENRGAQRKGRRRYRYQ